MSTDQKVSELVELAVPDNADYLHVVDTSAGESKKSTVGALRYAPGDIRLYGGDVTASDNLAAFKAAIADLKGTGIALTLPAGTFDVILVNNGTDDRLTIDDDLIIQGSGRTQSKIQFLPNDVSFQTFGIRIDGANVEARDFQVIPPTISNIATVAFGDLVRTSAFWINPNATNHTVLIERVDVPQGFETAIQVAGDGSAGWRLHINQCVMYGYSVPIAAANSDDAVANNALRELWIHNTIAIGHKNQGLDWSTRGRCIYIHPHISCDYNNVWCYGSGSNRPQVAQFSSGSIPWNAHPPQYMRFSGVRCLQPAGWPKTEGFQTTNLVGVTSFYTDCVVDVEDRAVRIRGDSVFKGLEVRGITKSMGSSQPAAIKTFLAVAGSATDTTITVQDASIFSDTDEIIVWLDDRTLHTTTVNGAPAGNVITLTDALPSAAAVNSWVIHTISGADITATMVRVVDSHFKNDPNPDAMITGDAGATYNISDSIIDLDIQVTGSGFWHDTVGSKLVSKDNLYRSIGVNKGRVAEIEHASSEAYFDGDELEGTWDEEVMICPTATQIELDNIKSFANSDSVNNEFINGAVAQDVIAGSGSKYYGTAKPRTTNSQSLTPGKGMNPSSIASAATIALDMNYDIHRITGTTNISNILFENDATIDAMISGSVTLLFAGALDLVHGTRLKMPGAGNLTVAADEAVRLTFDSKNNKVYATKV